MAMINDRIVDLKPVAVAGSIEELLQGGEVGDSLNPGDSKSGATLERVTVDGEPFVLKRLSRADDWVMRTSDDDVGWTVRAWESGVMSRVPESIDHATVGAARFVGPDGPESAILMRDIGRWVVPDGDSVLSVEQNSLFLDHMAELHASFLGWNDSVGLMPLKNRYLLLSPDNAKTEHEYDPEGSIPGFIIQGWKQFSEKAPALASRLLPLHDDLSPFLNALGETPFTLLHGDWKATNLGTGPDGRTILLDWAFPGVGPPCSELAWFLAINSARIPVSKEVVIAMYRGALESHGVDTSPWWERQLELAFTGVMLQFGWEKALGGGEEFDWWVAACQGANPG